MAMNRKNIDRCLREAAQLARQKDLAMLPPKSELKGCHQFSERFEQRIAEIYAILDTPKPRSKVARRVLLVAAIIILLIIFTISVGAIRERVYELFLDYGEINADGAYVPVQQEGGSYIEGHDRLLVLYYPSYIPEGFSEVDRSTDDYTYRGIVYSNEQGNHIHFEQGLISGHFSIDAENTEEFYVTKGDITYFCSQKAGYITVLWNEDGYAFALLGKLSADEAIKIAESILAQQE